MMKKIAPDKKRHFYAGILMGLVVQGFLFLVLKEKMIMATVISLVLVMAISYGFELFSKITGLGHYDVMDAIASIIGGILGMGLAWGLQLIL